MITAETISPMVDNQAKARLELLAKLYHNKILCGQYLFPHHFFLPTAGWHKKYIEFIQKKHKHSLIVAPRGHGKTTAMQFYYIMPSILFKENNYILIISNTYDQAVKILEAIKYELMFNKKIIALFGNLKGHIWREDVICTSTGVFIEIAGADKKIRGFKYRENRPDLVYIDDLENDSNVNSPDQREDLIQWFYGAVMPALATNGRLVITGTILHYDSLLMRLSRDELWQTIWFSTVVDEDKKETLWKEHLDWDEYEKLKKSYHAVGLLDKFNCEYLNDPVPEGEGVFNKTHFKYFDNDDIKIQNLNLGITTDFAFTDKRKSDYNVIMVVGMDSVGDIYVLDYTRFRVDGDIKEIIDNIYNMVYKYNTINVGIEVVASQKIIGSILKEEMRRRNKFLNVKELKQSKTEKTERIKAELQPRFKAGNIYMKKWMIELEEELLKFPKAPHDDLVDSLHRAPEILHLGSEEKKVFKPVYSRGSIVNYFKYPLTARF